MGALVERTCPACGAPLPASAADAVTCPFCDAALERPRPQVIREIHTREVIREVVRAPAIAPFQGTAVREPDRHVALRIVLVIAVCAGFAFVVSTMFSRPSSRPPPYVAPQPTATDRWKGQSYEDYYGMPAPNDLGGLHVEHQGTKCFMVFPKMDDVSQLLGPDAPKLQPNEPMEVPCPRGM